MFQNQNNTSGFGQSNAFGGAPNTGGGFGQQQQPQNTGFGGGFGGQQQNQGSSLFGGQTQQNTGFGGASSGGFGTGQTSTGFGGASTGFGGPQTQQQQSSFSSFGGNNNAAQGGGLFGGNQQKPAGGGLFGQNTQGAASVPFGQQPNQSQGFGGQQNQTTGGGLFGANQQQNNMNSFNKQPSLQQPTNGQQGGGGFYKVNAMPQLHSQNNNFQFSSIQQDDNKGVKMNLRFRNIRIDDAFQLPSTAMLRLADMMAQQKGQPEDNLEFKAQQAWHQRQSQYPVALQQKLQALGGGAQGAQPAGANNLFGGTGASAGFGQNQSTGFGQQQSTGFGGQSAGFGFNQQQQQPQQTSTLFGGQQQQQPQQQSSLFGGGASTGFGQNQSTGFGGQQTSAFGQQNNATQGGLFNQNKPVGQQSTLFGGQTQQPASSGGLFGQQQPQQNASTGGLFGGQTQQQTGLGGGGGLFGNNQNQNNTQQPASGGLFGQNNNQQPATSGGLFGGGQTQQNNAQPGGGGLFSQNNSATPNTGGGLFGGGISNNTQKPGGSLFGGASAAPSTGGGGLFGGGQTAQPQGGLFGTGGTTQTNPSTGGGLFGAQPAQNTNTSGGGLFGGQNNNQQPATSGGLFGNKPATAAPTGGLFGGSQQQPSTGGGLFGGNTQQTGQSGGGLFGGNQQQNTGLGGGGGLFGNKPATTNTGGGLFGGQQNSTQNQGFNTQPGAGLNFNQQNNQQTGGFGVPLSNQMPNQMLPNIYDSGNRDPLGLEGGFLQNDTPVMHFEDEMEKIRQGAKNFIKTKTEFGNNQFSASFDFGGQVQTMHVELCNRPSEADREEEERYLAKLEMAKRAQYDPNFGQSAKSKSAFIKKTFSQAEGFKTSNNRVSDTTVGLMKQKSTSMMSPMQPMKHSSTSIRPSPSQLKHKDSIERSRYTQRQMTQSYNLDEQDDYREAFKSEIVNITAILKPYAIGNDHEKKYLVQIHQTWDISDVVQKILQNIKRDFDKDVPEQKVRLLYQNALLDNHQTLDKVVASQTVTFQILIDPSVSNEYNPAAPAASQPVPEINDWRPKPPKAGHQTEPSFDSLQQLSKHELERLPSFKIKNQFGEISFQNSGGIDVTGQDLSVFEITKGQVVGYEDQTSKPRINTKLNLACLVTLIFDKDISEAKLKKFIEKQNQESEPSENGEATHLSFANRVWEFRVPHWSKWGFGDDDDDEEEMKEEQKPIKPVKKVVEETKEAPFVVPQQSIFTNSLQKPPVSIFTQDPKYGSPAYSQKFGGQEQISLSSAQKAPIVTDRYLRRKQMLKTIADKEKALQQIDKRIETSVMQTQAEMSKLGVKKNPMHLSIRGMRPCWNQNGDIMTIVQKPNSIVAKIQPVQTKVETSEIPKVVRDCQSIQNVAPTMPTQGDFFTKLFNDTKIPMVRSESTICQLLKSSANELLKEKKNSEFYIVCLLNALYGDPRIHLAHMHPLYTSKNGNHSFEKAWKMYSSQAYFDEKSTFQTQKQRRNAVAEVFRLLCQKEFQTNDAYQMLLNGDVATAVRTLGKQGKHSLARCVAQSMSAQCTTKQRINFLNAHQGDGNVETQKIVDLITSDAQTRAQRVQRNEQWQQIFCSLMLYTFESQISLKDIIYQFSQIQSFANMASPGGKEDILFSLLKIYTCQQPSDRICTFKKIQDLSPQIKWLIHHVLRLYQRWETEQNVSNKIQVIPVKNVDEVTTIYIDQLIRKGNLKDALIMAMQIYNQGLKKRVVFQTLGKICQQMWVKNMRERRQMEVFLNDLSMPETFINVHVAWRSNPEQAIELWLHVGNYQDAHDLLITHMDLSEKFKMKPILEELEKQQIQNWRENGLTLLQFYRDLTLPVINEINSKLYEFGKISLDKDRMSMIQKIIQETLFVHEIHLKSQLQNQQALVSELAVQNCRNPDLVKRMIEQNQNDFINV